MSDQHLDTGWLGTPPSMQDLCLTGTPLASIQCSSLTTKVQVPVFPVYLPCEAPDTFNGLASLHTHTQKVLKHKTLFHSTMLAGVLGSTYLTGKPFTALAEDKCASPSHTGGEKHWRGTAVSIQPPTLAEHILCSSADVMSGAAARELCALLWRDKSLLVGAQVDLLRPHVLSQVAYGKQTGKSAILSRICVGAARYSTLTGQHAAGA